MQSPNNRFSVTWLICLLALLAGVATSIVVGSWPMLIGMLAIAGTMIVWPGIYYGQFGHIWRWMKENWAPLIGLVFVVGLVALRIWAESAFNLHLL